MPGLVDAADVQVRLTDIPGLLNPSKLTPERVQQYIEDASASIMSLTGYSTPPSAGSVPRAALEGLTVRLVVCMVRQDLFANDATMAEMLRRERQDIVSEAKSLAQTSAGQDSFHFEVI